MRLRNGPWFDPHCPRCEFGWIEETDDRGHECVRRCYDCQARSEAMKGARP